MRWCNFCSENGANFWAFGQPFVWTVGFVGVLIGSILVVIWFLLGQLNVKRVRIGLFIIGYWASYLPFAFVPRTIFFYHYIIPAIFSGMTTFALIDSIQNRFVSGFMIGVLCIGALFGLFYWGGFLYGFKMMDVRDRQWMMVWGR
jgi:dolichyl-phosphate-mannose--protein O-mannosyl transferase